MIEPNRFLDYYDLKRLSGRLKACKDADKRPMAVHWYEQDIPKLLSEIERLQEALSASLRRVA